MIPVGTRPTAAQIAVLRRCAAHEIIKQLSGVNPTWFFKTAERSINYRTVYALLDREWIEAFKATSHTLHLSYRITPAGQLALKVLDAHAEKGTVIA